MSDINNVIGKNVRRMRKSFGLTQRQLAEKLYIVPECICKWELGKVAPSAICLNRMADVFGCSIDELFGRGVEA